MHGQSAEALGNDASSAAEIAREPTIAAAPVGGGGYDTSRDEEYARLLQAQFVHVPGRDAYYYGTWHPHVPRHFHRDEWYDLWMGMIFVVFCLSFILLTISIIYYST